MKTKNVLVVGVGNYLLSDEGAGIHIAHRLGKMALPSNIEILDGGTGGFELIAFFRDRKKVILLDAVKTDDEPGTVYRFTLEDIVLPRRPIFSLHQFNLHELCFFIQQMKPRPEVVVYGIVPQETERFSTKLSQAVKKGIRKMLPSLLEEIRSISA